MSQSLIIIFSVFRTYWIRRDWIYFQSQQKVCVIQATLHKVELVPLQLHRNPMLLSHAPVLRSSIINIITDHDRI